MSSFTAHLAFPIGSEEFHVQLGMFPQYVILFALGVAAGRRGWLDTLTPALERRCGIAGIVAVSALLAALVSGGFFDGGAAEDRFAGGWHWEAAAFPLAEGVIAVCVSLWAIGFFRRRANHLSPLARLMAPFAYGAFVVHPPVIVGLALAIGPLPLPAEAKFVAVLVAGIAGSFRSRRAAAGRRIACSGEVGAGAEPNGLACDDSHSSPCSHQPSSQLRPSPRPPAPLTRASPARTPTALP